MPEELSNGHYAASELITHSLTASAALQNDKSTPLHLACTQGAFEVVKMMLSCYGLVEDVINLTDGAHQTPLHRSAYRLVIETTYIYNMLQRLQNTGCLVCL